MKISERSRSTEQCAEAGWYAFQYSTDSPLSADFILKLKSLGSFVFMRALKKPFFKVENNNYIIKGTQGDSRFVIATHRDNIPLLDGIERQIAALAAD